ncbi:MAG: hypothetical protein LBC07_05450 [Elusimicrobiota bacterium]|jgi:hypothetical protein|nr:hypothetical protein [Elusimicrobiota bacterium]
MLAKLNIAQEIEKILAVKFYFLTEILRFNNATPHTIINVLYERQKYLKTLKLSLYPHGVF